MHAKVYVQKSEAERRERRGFFSFGGGSMIRRNRIREHRIAAGLSQLQLARASGVDKPRIERLDANPCARLPADVGLKISQALGVPLEALIADEALVTAS
jgi:transcriptional regulator with XRE-family HTH domain